MTAVPLDIAALARIAHERGALFHTDAVQSAGKIPLSVRALRCPSLEGESDSATRASL